MRYIICLLLAGLGYACGSNPDSSATDDRPTETSDTAEWVIAKAITRHGGDQIDHSRIAFDFRDRHYIATRDNGRFTYERIWQDSLQDNYRDVLTNETLYREINGQRVALSAKDSAAYTNSTNSVIYFALLPYFLQDPAVRKTYLGKSRIKDQEYYKIQVAFRQEGGGKDFDDQYVYWIHPENFTMDYLAYNYVTEGGGARFREAYHIREISGIRFADFINYKPVPDTREVIRFDSLFNEGKMEELSRIETERVVVEGN